MKYKYKTSLVNQEKYLQIWADGRYIRSLGTAEKCHKKLVQLENNQIQTKNNIEKVTKILEQK